MYKWTVDYTQNTGDAPGIINTMINMFLKMGSTDGKPLYDEST